VGRAGGGGEEGEGGDGWAGRAGPGREFGLNTASLILFLFLSLFYLFQFDTMRKQMMR
jgi:hypothetical protein